MRYKLGQCLETEKSYRLSLKIIASIFLVASLVHILWNWFFPTYTEMKGLTEIQWDWIYLLNLSTALCLFTFSILSFGVSSTTSLTLDQLRAFSALMIIFWMIRLLLELIFPVQIPVLVLPDPSLFLKVLMVTLIVILALPEVRFHIRKKK
ncbi:MAG: hypothetical protein O8C67_11745 [Candidatus Methanoperedens sp.]|nr:hypothetical protein [Candidatus Methanoperedens sp.]